MSQIWGQLQAPAPNPSVVLRPLVIPSLSLEEELERLADTEEAPLAKAGPMHSALLEQVIAASSGRSEPVAATIGEIVPDAVVVEPVAVEPVAVEPPVAVAETELAPVEPPVIVAETQEPVLAPVEFAEVLPEPVAAEPPVAVAKAVFAPVEFAEALPEPVAVEPPVIVAETQEPVFAPVAFAEVSPEPVAVEPPVAVAETVFAPGGFAEVLLEPVAVAEVLPEPVAAEPPPLWVAEQDAPELATWNPEPNSFTTTAAEVAGPPMQGPVWQLRLATSPIGSTSVEAVSLPVSVELPTAATTPDADPVLTPFADEAELSAATSFESVELLPAFAESTSQEIELLPVEPELPVEVTSFASATLAESVQAIAPEPPPFWAEAAQAPIDIDSLRQPEPIPVTPLADVELPAGMFENAIWERLLTLPNPMSGILFTIILTKAEAVAADTAKKSKELEDLTPALEKLMASFVRGNDFGSRIADNEWVFVYQHDATGFNQRRVGGIGEKRWDFQLRHLGMSSVSFKWGAVEVQSEPLGAALEAARERMNQAPRRRSKLPGSDYSGPRQVVNA
ncbi:MAG: hypothetical protein FJW38_30505 [Acidobacteria bacterium]|nr:hypothetical protein [Acidobacteriota bacterium]